MKAAYSTKAAAPPREPLVGRGRKAAALVMGVLGAGLGGCVTVDAPTEPIVIELNINITQEVIYRLASDVQENIAENPEIF